VKPQILGRTVAYTGYLTVEKLRIRLADGTLVSRDVEAHGDAAAVLPYDVERQFALVVRLFRAPVFSVTQGDTVEEAYVGMIEHEPDEAPAPGSRRGVRRVARQDGTCRPHLVESRCVHRTAILVP
jgi:hypothetical protein